jgi:hypothetical protein
LDLEVRCGAVRTWGNLPLVEADPDVHAIMDKLTNKYSRGACVLFN